MYTKIALPTYQPNRLVGRKQLQAAKDNLLTLLRLPDTSNPVYRPKQFVYTTVSSSGRLAAYVDQPSACFIITLCTAGKASSGLVGGNGSGYMIVLVSMQLVPGGVIDYKHTVTLGALSNSSTLEIVSRTPSGGVEVFRIFSVGTLSLNEIISVILSVEYPIGVSVFENVNYNEGDKDWENQGDGQNSGNARVYGNGGNSLGPGGRGGCINSGTANAAATNGKSPGGGGGGGGGLGGGALLSIVSV